jgi:Skp family chaperone for outer membrane proteins
MAQRTTWLLAAMLAAANLLPAQGPTGNADKPAATKTAPAPAVSVGVVDLDKAIELYPKAIAERERLQTLSKTFAAEIDELTKQIDSIRSDLSLLKEGTNKREAREFELGMALKQREGLANLRKAQFDRELEKFELTIYQDVEVAVAEVAKMKGVQIVLRVRATPPPDEAGKEKETGNAQKQRLAGYDRRHVWFASDEVDLTPALIKYLQVPVDPKKADAPTPAPKGTADAGKAPAGSQPNKGGGE